jgi:hypothetical protein
MGGGRSYSDQVSFAALIDPFPRLLVRHSQLRIALPIGEESSNISILKEVLQSSVDNAASQRLVGMLIHTLQPPLYLFEFRAIDFRVFELLTEPNSLDPKPRRICRWPSSREDPRENTFRNSALEMLAEG